MEKTVAVRPIVDTLREIRQGNCLDTRYSTPPFSGSVRKLKGTWK